MKGNMEHVFLLVLEIAERFQREKNEWREKKRMRVKDVNMRRVKIQEIQESYIKGGTAKIYVIKKRCQGKKK